MDQNPAAQQKELALRERLGRFIARWKATHNDRTEGLTPEFLYRLVNRDGAAILPEARVREIVAEVLSASR
jgi:hypothetical protein